MKMKHLLFLLLFTSLIYKAAISGENIMKLDSLEAFPASVITVLIHVENDDPFVSFQLDIPIPEGFNYIENSVQLNPDRKVNHSVAANVLANGRLRILSYSMTNSPFIGNNGAVAWFELSTPAEAGEYLLELLNTTIGSSNNQNIITGTIDGLVILMNPLVIQAGAQPQTICESQSVQLNATVSGGGWFPEFTWTSDPPGFFSNLPNPTDNPVENTTYFLWVDDGHQNNGDTVSVTVQSAPTVFAGDDQSIEAGQSVITSQASAANYASFIWITHGDGEFSNEIELITEYFPGGGDIDNGQVTLELLAYGNMPCSNDSDLMDVYILDMEDNFMIAHGGEAFLFDTLDTSIEIVNNSGFSAFYCEITLPQSIEYIEGSASLTSRAVDHILEASLEEGNLLVINAFSPQQTLLTGNSGNVLTYSMYTGAQAGVFPMVLTNPAIYNPEGENLITNTYNGEIVLLLSSVLLKTDGIFSSRIFPSPVSALSLLELIAPSPLEVGIFVFDSFANTIAKTNIFLPAKGSHAFPLNHIIPDIKKLPAGIYICLIRLSGEHSAVQTIKFVITK
jgi:hypothetical protein